jgi:UDP-2,4-diacetamido-2,4,6-trideoxy-beta-L-altropyranose hydrolase
MNIMIRTDASVSIGTGHVVRCLTLSDELKKSGVNISFMCREENGNLIGHIEKKGYHVNRLPAGIDIETEREFAGKILERQTVTTDWLIIDHYDIDDSWETYQRQFVKNVMVIDDLSNRRHDCDLLLDQNYVPDGDRYKGLVPEQCVQLLGPEYALLRPQFMEARERTRNRNGVVRRILVFMGGADQAGQTVKALRAVQRLNRPDIHTDVVLGDANPYKNEIISLVSQIPNAECHINIENMAELMEIADLSIGACGVATWERCCLGLPSLVIAVAENQINIAAGLSKEGCLIYSGRYEDSTVHTLLEDLNFLIRHGDILQGVSLKAREIVDGKGIARVRDYLLKTPVAIRLRPLQENDCEKIFHWRNHPEVRKHSLDPSPLTWVEHEQWFRNTLISKDKVLFIGENNDTPIGVLRYEFKDDYAVVSVYLVPGNSGKGFGPRLLKAGSRWIKENRPEAKRIVAEILPQNEASIKAFRKAGFKKAKMIYIQNLKEDFA